MDLKSLPSDNIYKYIFLLGVFLTIYVRAFLINESYQLHLDRIENIYAIKEFTIENNHDTILRKEYIGLLDNIKGKLIETINLKNNYIDRSNTNNLSLEVSTELKKQIIASDSLISVLEDKAGELDKQLMEAFLRMNIKANKIRMTVEIINEKSKRLRVLNYLSFLGIVIGPVLLFYGLYNWMMIQLLSEKLVFKDIGRTPGGFDLFDGMFKWFKKKKNKNHL